MEPELLLEVFRKLHLHPPTALQFPLPRHARQEDERHAHQDAHPGKDLGADVAAALGGDDGAGDGVAGEHGEADNGESHAHARPALAQVRGQAREARGEQGLDAARGDAVEDGPGVELPRGVHGDPGQEGDARDEAGRDHDVEGPHGVGKVVGQQAADEADAVHEQEEVERVRVRQGRVDGGAAKGGDVVEAKVDGPKVL